MAEALPLSRNGKLSISFIARWQESLRWRIACAYAGVLAGLGVAVVGTVYPIVGKALRLQFDRQAAAIATNLSDVAAGYLGTRQPLGLYAYVTKYARLEGVAYVFIEDRSGKIVTHSMRAFPVELLHRLSPEERRQAQQVTRTYQGKTVYETRVPILEGQLGAVHLGMWADIVEDETRGILLSLFGALAGLFVLAVIVGFLLAHGIVRPIRHLTDVAGKISTGDLEVPIALDSRDEIGELARSLERMRASLKAAIWRLSRAN